MLCLWNLTENVSCGNIATENIQQEFKREMKYVEQANIATCW